MGHFHVIGSGVGGIAAALRLRARGHAVTLLERNPDPGGRARTFSLGGYHFDAGPTVITAPYLFAELFTLFGEDINDHVDFRPLSPVWYRYQYADGTTLDYGAKDFFLAQIERHFPEDQAGYLKLCAVADNIFNIGYLRLADQPFNRLGDMLATLPAILRLKGYRSVYNLIAHYIKSDKLRQALCTAPLLLGGNPKTASAIYFLIHILEQRYGIHYAMGGTSSIVNALTNLAERQGVNFHYNKTVSGLSIDGAKIRELRCADGSAYPVDSLVYNGDPTYLYRDIIPSERQSWLTRLRMRYQKPSMGLLVIYFVTSRRYPDIAHHTIGFGKSYDGVLANIFDRDRLGEDFSFYLHRPTATDPAAAAPDHDLFYVLIPTPHLQHRQPDENTYVSYSEAVIAALEQRLLPDLRQTIIARHHISPLYFRDTLLSAHGAGFSLMPTLTQSAWFRYHNRDPKIKNLYLVGAGTHPGAGLPGVLNSAKILEKTIA